MQQEVFSCLKRISFLARIPDAAVACLAAKAKLLKFPKQAVIISEGDEGNSLHVIISGKVRVYTSDEKSKEITLMVQEAGSYFGELALLCGEPRSASVEALDKTVCGVISRDDFKTWLESNPEAVAELLRELSEKIMVLTERVKQMALSNVYGRTIKVLQDMASHQENGVSVIPNRPTQQELANMVGSSREMINKIMKELTKGGYIVVQDKSLRIENKPPANW